MRTLDIYQTISQKWPGVWDGRERGSERMTAAPPADDSPGGYSPLERGARGRCTCCEGAWCGTRRVHRAATSRGNELGYSRKNPSRTRVSNPVVLTPSDMLTCEMQRTESSITTMPEPTRLETDTAR